MSRLPLRASVMVWFGLVSLLVTSVLAILTWQLSTDYMISQRERSAVRQATGNSRFVSEHLMRDVSGLDELLDGLGAEFDSAVRLADGRWIRSGAMANPGRLPPGFVRAVEQGQAAHQRVDLGETPVLVVSVPLPEANASYVETSPLLELDRTFSFLGWILTAGTAASAMAGALLGRWAATHSLRPLSELTTVARAAAAGDLSVRLPATRDPDLIPLARAFNGTAERLQQRVTQDARFAGDVSHELRSPLTTMLNAMSVLQRRRAELSPDARQAVDLLDTDLRRFRRMVDDLLEISRHDQDENELNLELVDLTELVRHAARQHTGTDLSDQLDIPGPSVNVDRRCLERVVANLIENADRHGHGLVRLSVLRRNGHARIEVDDAGPGVPHADRESIFERFARGNPAERDGADSGVGLGLALVAQHVRRHAGVVWVEERPGGGARFIVELPEARA